MKKLMLGVAALLTAMSGHAQLAKVSQPEPILKGQESAMYNPVMSADGQHLLFSDTDYSNLRTYDFQASAVAKVANTDRRTALWANFDNNGAVSFDRPAVTTEGSTLVINRNGKTTVCSPAGECAGYIWASLSPDGSKVMFVAAGKGVYITDLNGNVLATPGNYEAPVWFGNNHIIAQKSTDDGHQYSSSQIVLLTMDGTESQALTQPESMTFSPAASSEAERVVFSTIDGRLFQINVSLY